MMQGPTHAPHHPRDTELPRYVERDEAHFAAIAAEDAIAAECDREWDNLIVHFETELQRSVTKCNT